MANSESDNSNRYKWQKPLQEALLEFDAKALQQKVADAETAIFERLQTLAKAKPDDQINPDDQGKEERQALQDAVNSLRVLKREALNFPDWRPD